MSDQSYEIKDLKRRLLAASSCVVSLCPDQFFDVLRGDDFSNPWLWQAALVDAVVAAAQPDQRGRAACPLCRSRTKDTNTGDPVGFTVPEGLAMHLRGSHRAHQCTVVKVVFERHRDRMNDA